MIGIIGGNGVAATNRLCQLIEERCTRKGAFRDGHHPEMLISVSYTHLTLPTN